MGRKNLIILTPGRSGSSVLTGVLASAGYWPGETTATAEYETYEASRLIELNNSILSAAGFGWHDIIDLPPPSISGIQAARKSLDPAPYKKFLARCDSHAPWIWKDPRLSYTVHFWEDLLALDRCRFVIMNRDSRKAWTGLLRGNRLILSEGKLRIIREACLCSARLFLERNDLGYQELDFDEFVANPDPSLERLNQALSLELSRDDLAEVYRGPLGKQRWGSLDYLLGMARYVVEVARGNAITFPRKDSAVASS